MAFPPNQITEKFNIAAVSYLNTKPLLYGLLNSPLAGKINLMLDIPSACASKMIHDEVDLALIPTAVIPLIPNATLFSNYCIGAQNKVKTVGIFSYKPIKPSLRSSSSCSHMNNTSYKAELIPSN